MMNIHPTNADYAQRDMDGRPRAWSSSVDQMAASHAIDLDTLAALPLFSGIARDELRLLCTRLVRVAFPAGKHLLAADQPGEVAYVILAGTLRVLLADADGNEITLALLGPGEIVGETALVNAEVRAASVTTHEPVVLLAISCPVFADARQRLHRLVDNLIQILARRVRQANAQVLALATLDVAGRVARQLLLLAESYGRLEPDGVRIALRLTQDDLAHLVGATRVRVNQAIGHFRRNGFLVVDTQHRFVIRDTQGLASYV
jgi:CRP-like cAMP-binding protein